MSKKKFAKVDFAEFHREGATDLNAFRYAPIHAHIYPYESFSPPCLVLVSSPCRHSRALAPNSDRTYINLNLQAYTSAFTINNMHSSLISSL